MPLTPETDVYYRKVRNEFELRAKEGTLTDEHYKDYYIAILERNIEMSEGHRYAELTYDPRIEAWRKQQKLNL
jgi:hypothetical protein